VVDWAQSQPVTAATRHEVLRRYSDLLGGRTTQLARFMQEGQAAIRDLAAGTEMRKRIDQLVGILATPGHPLPNQLRARVALMALHVGAFAGREIDATDEQRRDAALQLALEIVGPAS